MVSYVPYQELFSIADSLGTKGTNVYHRYKTLLDTDAGSLTLYVDGAYKFRYVNRTAISPLLNQYFTFGIYHSLTGENGLRIRNLQFLNRETAYSGLKSGILFADNSYTDLKILDVSRARTNEISLAFEVPATKTGSLLFGELNSAVDGFEFEDYSTAGKFQISSVQLIEYPDRSSSQVRISSTANYAIVRGLFALDLALLQYPTESDQILYAKSGRLCTRLNSGAYFSYLEYSGVDELWLGLNEFSWSFSDSDYADTLSKIKQQTPLRVSLDFSDYTRSGVDF